LEEDLILEESIENIVSDNALVASASPVPPDATDALDFSLDQINLAAFSAASA